ncbi:PREDICTED: RNA polymerase II degradation factor 1 [Polistes dominula]|uniref:RNA polymerase II degradation factor 1 n=1 Tax=Polistes dominula TaxID=743375 RepID=A0ABM1ICF5_POLDO|nr:PREDICTED: RNA polymerase II degradation factor 1 [Polistes dominula]
MYTLVTVATVVTLILSVSAQRYQQIDDYADYQAPRPAHPTPRSYSSDSAPARQQAAAPESPKPTPVAILKQINRHNEDGSYTYGFEGADGSFKIETKLPGGEVKGKYGFVDDTGKVRVVEYGANQYGFQPAGEGITVAPPTLVDETTGKDGLQAQNYQDYDYQQAARPQAAPQQAVPRQPQYQPQYQPQPQPQPQSHTQAVYAPAQQAPSQPALPKAPIFSPSIPSRQSPLLQHSYDEPSPTSQVYNQGPAQFAPAPVQERGQPQTRSQSGGILDQLARDYALPQGVAPPLHDISFGYY